MLGNSFLAWNEDGDAIVALVAFDAARESRTGGGPRCGRRGGSPVPGDVLPDCAGDWIDGDRERLRQRAQQVLTRLVGLLEREKRLPMRSIRLNTCSGSIHSTSKHGVRSCTRAA